RGKLDAHFLTVSVEALLGWIGHCLPLSPSLALAVSRSATPALAARDDLRCRRRLLGNDEVPEQQAPGLGLDRVRVDRQQVIAEGHSSSSPTQPASGRVVVAPSSRAFAASSSSLKDAAYMRL